VLDPFVLAFVVLLAGYVGYSLWARLDPRLPFAGALAVLVVAAIADAAQAVGTADVLAEFVLLLLAAGVLLVVLEHARKGRRRADRSTSVAGDPEATDPAEERDRSAEQSLDGAQQHPVPLVDTPGQEHDDEEEAGDPETDHGQAP
jgi:hypothetical protein